MAPRTTTTTSASRDPSSSPGMRLTRWLESVLWLVALACLGWAGSTWAEARLFQARALSTAAGTSGAARAPAAGEPVARLWIPRLGVSVLVAEGTGESDLRKAVGHLPSSPLPGRSGNVVLAGHRDTFFRPLEKIRAGDAVLVETSSGTDVYSVAWTRVVDPSTIEVAAPTAEPALTLITCFPFRFVGNAPQRFIVRAHHLKGPAGRVTATRAVRSAAPSSP